MISKLPEERIELSNAIQMFNQGFFLKQSTQEVIFEKIVTNEITKSNVDNSGANTAREENVIGESVPVNNEDQQPMKMEDVVIPIANLCLRMKPEYEFFILKLERPSSSCHIRL